MEAQSVTKHCVNLPCMNAHGQLADGRVVHISFYDSKTTTLRIGILVGWEVWKRRGRTKGKRQCKALYPFFSELLRAVPSFQPLWILSRKACIPYLNVINIIRLMYESMCTTCLSQDKHNEAKSSALQLYIFSGLHLFSS